MSKKKYKFIDLFAGIGGFHIAFDNVGAECVMACEIDKYARETYQVNLYKKSPGLFDNGCFFEDIRDVKIDEMPDFDILCGGFPCQSFSQAGHKLGFKDDRGNLFFEIVRLIEGKQPKAFFLENVRHLLNHDNGRTFEIIKSMLIGLGYTFDFQIVKASDFGLPQHRPRLYMIGFKKDYLKVNAPKFNFPKAIKLETTMSDIFGGECEKKVGFTLRVGGRGSNINDRRNWDNYMVDGKVKKLGIKEGKKMMGLPDRFEFPVSDTQAMKQLGNSVAVPAIQHVAQYLIDYLEKYYEDREQVRVEGVLCIPKITPRQESLLLGGTSK